MTNVIEGLSHETTLGIGREIFFECTVVNGDLAGACTKANASDTGLSTTGSQAISADLVFLDEHGLNLARTLSGNENFRMKIG
jgi:hypothetical protein